jgi:hypothetical protein
MQGNSDESSTAELLACALEETREVERLIEQGEWQQALDHDSARQRLLAAAFAHDVEQSARRAPDAGLRAITDEILGLNNRLIGLAEHRRRGVERNSDLLQRGRRAADAYHRVSSDQD